MSFTEVNHYVPQWYQKRFIPAGLKERKLFYLDLKPDKVVHSDGKFHYRGDLRKLGPASCFMEKNLYTRYFGNQAYDVIEKSFFGKLDMRGLSGVNFYSNYSVRDGAGDAFRDLGYFLNAQKLRTPKGLDYLKVIANNSSHQIALALMEQLYQIHGTIWAEGVWEVLECDKCDTKFVISDHPVTNYNKKIFPADKMSQYPYDAPIERVGTHTIFPLNLNRCLVITNLEYVRFPQINPLKVRENPRYFQYTVFKLDSVQTGRNISERDVKTINYIIKKRARRFIAAAKEEWLYPERFLKNTVWNKLGSQFFLMPDPRKVPFTTEMSAGWGDGSTWRSDEYGRRSHKDDPTVKAKRDFEFYAFNRHREDWDKEFGCLSRDELLRFLR